MKLGEIVEEVGILYDSVVSIQVQGQFEEKTTTSNKEGSSFLHRQFTRANVHSRHGKMY